MPRQHADRQLTRIEGTIDDWPPRHHAWRGNSNSDRFAAVRAFSFLTTLAIGGTVGLGLTWFATVSGYGLGAVEAGPWHAWPKSGTEDADPYALRLAGPRR